MTRPKGNQYTRGKGTHIDRFWASVRKSDGCWEWQGRKNANGYGVFSLDRKHVLAHRFVLAITSGSVPSFLAVCHHCDNPSCVNPDHLFVGTKADNSRDMVEKGRSSAGQDRPLAKLTEDEVKAIRARYEAGETQRAIAFEFGVNQSTVSRLVRHVRWARVA